MNDMKQILLRQHEQRLIEARRWLKMQCPQLSARELNIVRLISYGFSHKEIADLLYISPLTVDSHIKNIYDALEIHKETELTRWYIIRCHKIKEKTMFLDFCFWSFVLRNIYKIIS
jgi:DNA-binding NarL/FixJ family response regulator